MFIIHSLFICKFKALDMVVRDETGNILDINSTSTTQLYEHHVNAVDRIRRASVNIFFFDFNKIYNKIIN